MTGFEARAEPERGDICRQERIWGNTGVGLICVAMLLNSWLWFRGLDTFIAVFTMAVGWCFRWVGERAGRKADAQRVLAWAEGCDGKRVNSEGTHA